MAAAASTNADMSAAEMSSVDAAVQVPTPPSTPAPPRASPRPAASGGLVADARPAMSVRRYFGRLVSATPAGLTIDFTRWQAASVERYFLAITSPGLIRRREPATTGAEVLRLPNAFDGFEWD